MSTQLRREQSPGLQVINHHPGVKAKGEGYIHLTTLQKRGSFNSTHRIAQAARNCSQSLAQCSRTSLPEQDKEISEGSMLSKCHLHSTASSETLRGLLSKEF